jgi:hypothetical protein
VKPINFGTQSSPDPVIGYDSHHEGVDPDSSCRSSTSESRSESEQDSNEHCQQKQTPPASQGTHLNQAQRLHTTGNFLKTTPFKTHTRPSEFGRPKLKSDKYMLEQIEKLLAYDEPLQRARTNPDIASKCRYCKTNPAVRDFPDISGGNTASCAPCRTQFELTATYGRYTKQSVKCHICGSHQNRSNKTRKPTSPTDATGWAKHKEGYACAPCKKTETRQSNFPHPSVNFALPNARRLMKHNRCLICQIYSPKGGTFLHHRVCTKHNAGAPTAHQITTARVWKYLMRQHPLFAGNPHNPVTVSNFVTQMMSSGTPITAERLEKLPNSLTIHTHTLLTLTKLYHHLQIITLCGYSPRQSHTLTYP